MPLPGLDTIMPLVEEVAQRFAHRGHRLYLVGGVVRDLALGSLSAADDIDLTTDATPRQIKDLVAPVATALWTQGERFGTIGATVNGRALEITTHRAEAYDPASRKPVVVFGRSVRDDLERRDFTINAMAVSLPDGELIDPFGGLDHLRQRTLATPLSPTESFSDDPLRMLRAARFIPRFDLEPEPGVAEAARTLADRLGIVSVERVNHELERLLALAGPGPGVAFLHRCRLLVEIVPAYRDQPPAALERAAGWAAGSGSALVRRAGLVQPLGPDGARVALNRLRYSRAVVSATINLLTTLPAVTGTGAGPQPVDVRRVVDRVGLAAMDDLGQLAANVLGAEAARPFFALLDELSTREDLGDLSVSLTGRQIMSHLGLDPGPEVGEATRHLRHRRLVDGPLTEAQARSALDRWWAERAPRRERPDEIR